MMERDARDEKLDDIETRSMRSSENLSLLLKKLEGLEDEKDAGEQPSPEPIQIDQNIGFLEQNQGEVGISDRGDLNLQGPTGARHRSVFRLKYESEVDVIRRQIGSLEDIRQKLGLSRRKMCQLLMVDPSAWSRWTSGKGEDSAPPHIYRALEWYLLLTKEAPAYAHSYWITASGGRFSQDARREDYRVLIQQMTEKEAEIQNLRIKLESLEFKIGGRGRLLGFMALVFGLLFASGLLGFFIKSLL